MLWDVGVGASARSLVDSGFYPDTAEKAIQLGDQIRWFLGVKQPVTVCANRDDAKHYLRSAGEDAIAVWPFDWDKVSW